MLAGCIRCHEAGGKDARVGATPDDVNRAGSPVLVLAAMWNHGLQMAEARTAKQFPWLLLTGR